MKLCNGYRLWLRKQPQSGLKVHTNALREFVLQFKASSKDEAAEIHDRDDPACWICLEAEPDESGQPLRRNCACRGESAGFAHLSCIVAYAEHQNIEQDGNQAWYECPTCEQYYEDELALDLANKSVAFVTNEFPDDKEIHLEALSHKLYELVDVNPTEAEETASQIISIIGQLRLTNIPLSNSICRIEARTFNDLGRLANSAKAAVAHYERFRDLSTALGDAECALLAEVNIAEAKSKSGDGICIDQVLNKARKLYEYSVKKHGEEDFHAIGSGLRLAGMLIDTYHGVETQRLLTKLAISERVLGPDHYFTQAICVQLQYSKMRQVTYLGDDEGKFFIYQALQYAEDGEKCIIQGPISDPRNVKGENKLTVASKHVFSCLGTPIVCLGMECSPQLNGKIGNLISLDYETDCYPRYVLTTKIWRLAWSSEAMSKFCLNSRRSNLELDVVRHHPIVLQLFAF